MLSLLLLAVTGYVVRGDFTDNPCFDVPAQMMNPGLPLPNLAGGMIATIEPFVARQETPMQSRDAFLFVNAGWNGLAAYTENALTVEDQVAPMVRVPAQAKTRTYEVKAMAWLYTFALAARVAFPQTNPVIPRDEHLAMNGYLVNAAGLNPIAPSPDAVACRLSYGGDASARQACMAAVAVAGDYCPSVIAQIQHEEQLIVYGNDGWNQFGQQRTPLDAATANLRPFRDYTDYMETDEAAGYDDSFDSISGDSFDHPGFDDEFAWKPLLEDDKLGYFTRQEHVTPHLRKARTYSISREWIDARVAAVPPPGYGDYQQVANEVVDLMNGMDDERKRKIEYFDSKIKVSTGNVITYQVAFNPAFDEWAFITMVQDIAKLDSTITAFSAKVAFNLIRPTTIIQRWGTQEITTWGGPFQSTGYTMNAQDFESYVRVMPHSEYPSASACLCLALNDAMEAASVYIRGSPYPFVVSQPLFPGSSPVEPGVSPVPPAGSPPDQPFQLFWPNHAAYTAECGTSRLWGGMHFAASVPAGYGLCQGLGAKSFDYALAVLNGHAF